MNSLSAGFLCAAILAGGLIQPAFGNITISDTIELTNSTDTYSDALIQVNFGTTEIHSIDFTVLSDGVVVLDVLSAYAFSSFIDSRIAVYVNDGQPFSAANLVAINDDWDQPDTNGSTRTLDSYLRMFMSARDYTVTIGHINSTYADANAGFQTNGVVYGTTGVIPTNGHYQLDILGDVELTASPTGCNPADLNADGVLDFFDISAFVQAYTMGIGSADFNADGVLDFFDISAFIQIYTTGMGCP